jgi:hypothetical protein
MSHCRSREEFDSNKLGELPMRLIQMTLLCFVMSAHLNSYAQLADCASAQKLDYKNQCLALKNHDPRYCEAINDNDMKFFCVAKVTRDRIQCNFIRALQTKQDCFSTIR